MSRPFALPRTQAVAHVAILRVGTGTTGAAPARIAVVAGPSRGRVIVRDGLTPSRVIRAPLAAVIRLAELRLAVLCLAIERVVRSFPRVRSSPCLATPSPLSPPFVLPRTQAVERVAIERLGIKYLAELRMGPIVCLVRDAPVRLLTRPASGGHAIARAEPSSVSRPFVSSSHLRRQSSVWQSSVWSGADDNPFSSQEEAEAWSGQAADGHPCKKFTDEDKINSCSEKLNKAVKHSIWQSSVWQVRWPRRPVSIDRRA